MTKFIDGKILARQNGCSTHREWIVKTSTEYFRKNMLKAPWNGQIADSSVNARIDFGRWVADCQECGGTEYVDVDEKIFFCFSCGNAAINGKALKVIFPENMDEIESELLQRKVVSGKEANDIVNTMMSKPMYAGLGRSWNPGETVADLAEQRRRKEGKL